MTEQLVTATNHDSYVSRALDDLVEGNQTILETKPILFISRISVFCSGTTALPNGVVMISGGSNSKATTFYNSATNQWSVGPEMIRSRGYQAHTLLATGEVFSYGGSWSGSYTDKAGEVWSPTSNTWRLLTGVPSSPAQTADSGGRYRADNHYWIFLAPGGRVRTQTVLFYNDGY
jgi:hypothetical protein